MTTSAPRPSLRWWVLHGMFLYLISARMLSAFFFEHSASCWRSRATTCSSLPFWEFRISNFLSFVVAQQCVDMLRVCVGSLIVNAPLIFQRFACFAMEILYSPCCLPSFVYLNRDSHSPACSCRRRVRAVHHAMCLQPQPLHRVEGPRHCVVRRL